jgi:hypothetical protein
MVMSPGFYHKIKGSSPKRVGKNGLRILKNSYPAKDLSVVTRLKKVL